MSLQDEIGLNHPLKHRAQETLLNIIVTSSLLLSEAQQLLAPYGLTDSQLNILMMLKFQSENGRLNQTELGRMVLVKRSGLTGLVDRMENAGLVRRIADPTDRRVNLVEMTDQGRSVLELVQEPYFKRIEAITSALDADAQTALSQSLETLRKQLRSMSGTE